jgi:hypothetical protein
VTVPSESEAAAVSVIEAGAVKREPPIGDVSVTVGGTFEPPGVGVTVGVCVAVGVEAGGVGVRVGVRVAVRVQVGVRVKDGVPVEVRVGVDVGGGGVAVAVAVAVAVRVAVGVGVGVRVGVRVAVGVGVFVGVVVGAGVVVRVWNVAVYVFELFARMSCSWAPPSDHDVKTFVPCGEGASMPSVEFLIAFRVNGVVPVNVPTESWRPVGTL